VREREGLRPVNLRRIVREALDDPLQPLVKIIHALLRIRTVPQ
jgi:hypothetical protein